MSKIDKYLNEEKEEPEVDVLDKLEIQSLIKETKEYLEDEEMSEMAIQAAGWTVKSVEKFGKTIGKSPYEHGFFDKCYNRMVGKPGWDDDKAKGFCARLIDTAKGTTYWRKGRKKKE